MVHKTTAEARKNLEDAIGYIPARYEAGVMKADWFGPASSEAAERNYASAVAKAVTDKSRQKAIKKVSNEDWKSGAINKGAPIIGERIRMALGKYETNFGAVYEPVLNTVRALPPRGVDFMANINNRLVPVVKKWKEASGKL